MKDTAARSIPMCKTALCLSILLCAATCPPGISHARVIHSKGKVSKLAVKGEAAKDQEIIKLKAQIKQLEADLALAQTKIDSSQSQAVTTDQSNAKAVMPAVTFSDIRAVSFPDGDTSGDPLWVVTFEIKNEDKMDVPLPHVYLNCTDNNIGNASPYSGDKGIIVVNPSTIHPGQDMHVKYSWLAASPTERPNTITISTGGTGVVEPVSAAPSSL